MKNWQPILFGLIAAALFGAATPVSKVLLGDFSQFQLAGILYLGAALGVLPLTMRGGGWRSVARTDRQTKLKLGGAILFGGVLGPVLLLFGLRAASAASVSMWLNLEVVATAMLGQWFFRDATSRQGWGGLAGIVLAGVLLSVHEGAAGVGAGVLVALACVCWGLDNNLTALIAGIRPVETTLWKGLLAGLVNLLVGLTLEPFHASLRMTLAGLAVGASCYGASIALYITSAQALGATRAQMLFASAPFFGVALAALLVGESISALQAVAALIMVGSLWMLSREHHEHGHTHEALAHIHSHRHDDGHHTHTHPGLPVSTRHTHWHEHEPTTHAHPHLHDLHHRHVHQQGDGDKAGRQQA